MLVCGVRPNEFTFTFVLPACPGARSASEGRRAHGNVLSFGCGSNVFVATALVDMYGKCGDVRVARKVFDGMPVRVLRASMEITVHLGAALINMYARCGSIKESRRVFDGIPERDLISWTAIICGYGMHRLAEDAELLFTSDGVTFMGLLMGFSHRGLVQKGQQYYGRMIQQYGFKPTLEHHSSMVDKLGRAGRLDEAEEFIGNMDVEPDAGVWGGLLNACKSYGNVDIGERVIEQILRIDPGYAGWYVLMSNIYAFARCWDGVARMRLLMKENRISKPPGWSSIEIGGQMHTFLAFDKLHPRSNEIYKFLKDLEKRMRI
ncbi:unnamed protein product [Musa acuminata var. zebrina]